MIIRHKIKLDSIEKVDRFVSIVDKFENDIDIMSGRYLVNGKSILALFSLKLTEPLDLIVHDVNISDVIRLEELIKEFRVDEI